MAAMPRADAHQNVTREKASMERKVPYGPNMASTRDSATTPPQLRIHSGRSKATMPARLPGGRFPATPASAPCCTPRSAVKAGLIRSRFVNGLYQPLTKSVKRAAKVPLPRARGLSEG
ncbi:hypothetical protein AZA_72481 [Nitrospirillum viridazoti Y2]|nr:hypothetical protein AZA_72481 [Nitrospirillum amazonense Y2]